MRYSKKLVAGLAVVTAGLLTAGVAYAAWTSSGSGSGTAKSTTSINSAIAADTSAADLFPGATKSITVSVSNPNPYPIVVTQISAGTSDAIGTTSCVAGSVTSDLVGAVTPTAASPGVAKVGGGAVILAGGSGAYQLTTHMINGAHDDCKSQSFNLPLTAAVRSAAGE